jgi:hypothetical protein
MPYIRAGASVGNKSGDTEKGSEEHARSNEQSNIESVVYPAASMRSLRSLNVRNDSGVGRTRERTVHRAVSFFYWAALHVPGIVFTPARPILLPLTMTGS